MHGVPSSSSASPLATQQQAARSRILLAVERGLRVEVEGVEAGHERELRNSGTHAHTALLTVLYLGFAQQGLTK
jgi:hypothetical protein